MGKDTSITEPYSPVGVLKSRVCSIIARSERVRSALNYLGTDAAQDFDPEDHLSYIRNCIVPFLKDPSTITTTDPQILVGVDTQFNPNNPGVLNCYITIVIVINYDDMKTDRGYIRDDLLDDGVVCYTKADLIAEEILMALAQNPSKTWIGEIRLSSSEESSLNNSAHYARKLHLYVQEINPENRGV